MLKYVVEENNLTAKDANSFYARPVEVRIRTEEDMAEAIAKRNIGISKPAYLSLHEAEAEILEKWIIDGDSYTSKTVQIHLTLPGALKIGECPKKAAVRITAGKRLREAAKKVKTEKTNPHDRLYIEYVEDTATGSVNSEVMSGAPFTIVGHNLKLTGTDPSVGIEFHSLENPEAIYRVNPRGISVNNPSKLIFLAPWMATGEPVTIRVTTQYSPGHKFLKTPRSCTFNKALTVVSNDMQKPG